VDRSTVHPRVGSLLQMVDENTDTNTDADTDTDAETRARAASKHCQRTPSPGWAHERPKARSRPCSLGCPASNSRAHVAAEFGHRGLARRTADRAQPPLVRTVAAPVRTGTPGAPAPWPSPRPSRDGRPRGLRGRWREGRPGSSPGRRPAASRPLCHRPACPRSRSRR